MNTIETQVLRLIGENVTTPDVFTDDATGMALIRGSVNDAIQELCMVLGGYTRNYHLPLLEDYQFYRLEPEHDYIAYIVDVYDHDRKRKLTQTDIVTLAASDPYFLKTNGYPEQYLWIGHEVFGIYPYPASEGGMLVLKCVCLPKPYTQDYDPIYLRDYLQRAAVYYAVSEYYASRGDAKRAQQEHSRYLEMAQLTSLNVKSFERQWVSYNQDRKDKGNG